MFRFSQPSPDDIQRFLATATSSPLSYVAVGIASQASPAGYQIDAAAAPLGTGVEIYARAVRALRRWTMFDLGWTRATPSAESIAPSVNVAVVVRHLGIWSLNGCRVVYMLESDPRTERYGFAYGTLCDHAEEGEEVFEVSLDRRTGDVSYRIRAASRPRALLAKLGYPYTRLVQARFRADSCRRMQQAVTERGV